MADRTFITIPGWVLEKARLPYPDFLVYSFILQFTLSHSAWWGGFKLMAERLNLTKRDCKNAVDRLTELGAVAKRYDTVQNKTRLLLHATRSFRENPTEK